MKSQSFALIELPDDLVAKLPNRKWLTMLDFAYDPPQQGDEYFVCGFPAEMSNRNEKEIFEQTAILFPTTCEAVGERSLENFDRKRHLLFLMPGGTVLAEDGTPMPESLRGISGSAIWRVLHGHSRDAFKVEDIRMIGVQTHVYEKPGLIRATIWGAALTVLWTKFEDLRPSLKLHLPPRDIAELERAIK